MRRQPPGRSHSESGCAQRRVPAKMGTRQVSGAEADGSERPRALRASADPEGAAPLDRTARPTRRIIYHGLGFVESPDRTTTMGRGRRAGGRGATRILEYSWRAGGRAGGRAATAPERLQLLRSRERERQRKDPVTLDVQVAQRQAAERHRQCAERIPRDEQRVERLARRERSLHTNPAAPNRGADVAGVRLVPAQVRQRELRPGADVAGVSPVPAQMWPGRAQSRCRCGRGEPSLGADVAGVSPVPAQMWRRCRLLTGSAVRQLSAASKCSRRRSAPREGGSSSSCTGHSVSALALVKCRMRIASKPRVSVLRCMDCGAA